MIATTTYRWESSDPSLRFAAEALNRLANFHRPEDEPSLKGWRRVVENGDSFTETNVQVAASYLAELAQRAQTASDARYRTVGLAGMELEMAGELARAASNARLAASQLLFIFSAAKEGDDEG